MPGTNSAPPTVNSIAEYIEQMWRNLSRHHPHDDGSLIGLPHKYIVPGGRFDEQFYWDSYFIMLGLAADEDWDTVRGMIDNIAYQIKVYGFVPTANRSYFLSRSQPPVFALMVRLLAGHDGPRTLTKYLPEMLAEYRFWMKGMSHLSQTEHFAYRRVVQMPDGSMLNRYYDNKQTARPESHREDNETVAMSNGRASDKLFLHLRAAAESGWDFSSRWLKDPLDLSSIHTADIVPVDLNVLLLVLEETIAEAHNRRWHPLAKRRYRKLALSRKRAINHYLWSSKENWFMDYNFHDDELTGVMSLAGILPLYAGVVRRPRAQKAIRRLETDFLKAGGLVTTLQVTGQQWDAPNGWAPLHWFASQALRRYGEDELANKVEDRWLRTVEAVYEQTGALVEKYNVVDGPIAGGGGEYSVQEGFGWTNGVYQALKRRFKTSI